MTEEKQVTVRADALPTSLEEVRGMAEAFVKSGMFSDTKQLAQAIVKIQAGRELGLPPVYSMQNINLIRDRLTTSANTMAMLVKKSGKYNYRIREHTELTCSIAFFEDGKEVGVSIFSMEDAKRANLVKPDSGWVKFPRAMLFSRAISQGARIYAPDAIGGVYTDEEIRSIPPRPEEDSTGRIVEPVTEPEPEQEAPESTGSLVKEKGNGNLPNRDIDGLIKSLKVIRWTESTAKSWLRSQYHVDVASPLKDVCAVWTSSQAFPFGYI